MPLFSVIITTYNRPDKLINAIDSVLAQEFSDFELLIVNDGSSVSYDDVLKHIEGNAKIRYFYKKNEERSAARNFGIEKAEGKWVCFLDDDDIYYPNHLTLRNNAIRQNDINNVVFYSSCFKRLIDNTIEISIPQKSAGEEMLFGDLFFHISTVCIPANMAKKYFFVKDLSYGEDTEYYMQLVTKEHAKFMFINAASTEYIFHEQNSVSNWSSKFLISKLKTFNYFEKKYKHYIPKSYINKNMFNALIGLSNCVVKEKNTGKGVSYLLQSVKYVRDMADIRQFLGAIKVIIKV